MESRSSSTLNVERYSIRHQLRWKTNLIHTVVPDERNYYQEIVRISRLNYMVWTTNEGWGGGERK